MENTIKWKRTNTGNIININGHMLLNEDYVSFETAKLLKEKGFNEEIETIISPDGKIYYCDERSVFRIPHKKIRNSDINIYMEDCSCPSLQMAMKWLREEKHIFIRIIQSNIEYCACEIYFDRVRCHQFRESFTSYEDACEAAIKYCLTNLI